MKVVTTPDYRRWNPYQRELAASLVPHGVETRFVGESPGGLGLWRTLRAGDVPDVLHLHWLDRFIDGSHLPAALAKATLLLRQLAAARRRGVRIVWTVHNVVGHEGRHTRLERAVYRRVATLADRLIVHCPCATGLVIRAYGLPTSIGRRFSVVPHGSYVASYPNTVSRDEARERLGLARDARVFLFLGQLRRYKGLAGLLDAFAGLEAPRARLVIAGRAHDGGLGQWLAAAAARDPRLQLHLGFVPDADVQVFLNAADAVVLPLQGVLTSGSVVLAMSFARAVIAPGLGCLVDTLGHPAGLLYDPDQPGALGTVMRDVLDRDLDAVGQAHRERVERAPWSRVAQETYAVYRGGVG